MTASSFDRKRTLRACLALSEPFTADDVSKALQAATGGSRGTVQAFLKEMTERKMLIRLPRDKNKRYRYQVNL